MIQLNPPLPLNTPKGEGYAHILIDYGLESDLYWTVFITATGEVWTFSNRDVRASKNISLGRVNVTDDIVAWHDNPRADVAEPGRGATQPVKRVEEESR